MPIVMAATLLVQAQASASDIRYQIQEDATAIFRIASHFSTNSDYEPSPAVCRACIEEVALLKYLPADIQHNELEKVLVGRNVDLALEWLLQIGAVRLLLPELYATCALKQEPGRHHKDVWEHTKLVVKQAVPRPVVRWAALFHDIGKVPTRRFTKNGVHFHGHEEVGARMFSKLAKRLCFPIEQATEIEFIIRHHFRCAQYSPEWSDSALRRLSKDLEGNLKHILDLSRADITSKRPGRRRHLLFQITELKHRIEKLAEEDSKQKVLPKGLGMHLIKECGIPQNKQLGNLIASLKKACERGELKPHQDVSYYVTWVKKTGRST